MHERYPRYVNAPTEKDPSRVVKVKNEDDHQREFPDDYARVQEELAADHTGGRAVFLAQASAEDERERCALIAETFPKGGKIGTAIAAEIRGGPPPKPASMVEPDVPAFQQTDFGKPLNEPEDTEIHPSLPPVTVQSIINHEEDK